MGIEFIIQEKKTEKWRTLHKGSDQSSVSEVYSELVIGNHAFPVRLMKGEFIPDQGKTVWRIMDVQEPTAPNISSPAPRQQPTSENNLHIPDEPSQKLFVQRRVTLSEVVNENPISTFVYILLVIATGGVFHFFWFYLHRNKLAAFLNDGYLRLWKVHTLGVAYIWSQGLVSVAQGAIFGAQISGARNDWLGAWFLVIVAFMFAIGSGIFLLLISFRIRSKINISLSNKKISYQLNGFLTFLLTSSYLNYALNKCNVLLNIESETT